MCRCSDVAQDFSLFVWSANSVDPDVDRMGLHLSQDGEEGCDWEGCEGCRKLGRNAR